MLADARGQCDYLVVGLHIDPSVERPDKHPPIQTVDERMMMLRAVRWVDRIVTYRTERDLADLLYELRPDVRIIGSDWKGKAITAPDAAGRIYWHERGHTWSSSELRRRIYDAEKAKRDGQADG